MVGLRYVFAFGMPGTNLTVIYMLTAFIGQFVLIGVLPMLVLVVPVVMVIPDKRYVLPIGIVLAAIVLSLVVLDANIFAQYRYHLSRLTVEIFEPSTWVFTGIFLIIFLVLQTLLAVNIWQRVSRAKTYAGLWVGVVLVAVWVVGQSIHIWADATANSAVTSFNRFLPAYYPIKAKRRLAQLGWVDPQVVEQQRLLRQAGGSARSDAASSQLRYPINELRCTGSKPESPDVLFVLIDALRPDKISTETTPRIAKFAAESQNFLNHYSGGNSSRMGIFSLFYGLPSTYWQSFYELQREPLLMQQLRKSGYQVSAFSSVGFGSPAQIDRTVFSATQADALWAPDISELDKNGSITRQWVSWFAEQEADAMQPWFSFLYYDPGNAAAETAAMQMKADSLEAKYASYMDGIKSVDRNVAVVLEELQVRHKKRDTLIIVASDHGYEFDELGLGYVGHASNFGEYQLRSTLLIDWPGKSPRLYSHRSAHQDLPGTLLADLLNCTNPLADVSSGGNLFSGTDWEWLIAGSYNSHAIIEPEQIIVTYPGGMIDLLGQDYRPASGRELNASRIEQALLEMRRFYQ